MVLEIVIAYLRRQAEEITAISIFIGMQGISFTSEAIKFILSIASPIIVAYLVHVLKKNYWEPDRPFLKNVISDLKKLWKK